MQCTCCENQTHCRKALDPFMDRDYLAERVPLDNARKNFTYPKISPDMEEIQKCNLGALPTECYQACLQYLDIASLTTMRRVSQFTRSAIDSLPQYRDLYEHAPQALRACLATGIAPHIPIGRLHQSLTTMECYYCRKLDPTTPSYGTYLSLFECRRICLFCLRNNPAVLPVELSTLISLCCQRNCSIKSIENFRLVSTVPGIYSPSATRVFQRSTLVRGQSVTTKSGSSLSDKEQRVLFGKKESVDIHHSPLVPLNEESDVRPSEYYVSPENPKRTLLLYQTAILFPYLTSGKQIADYGILCEDCNLHMRWEEKRWTREQQRRMQNFMSPSATDEVIAFMNRVRRKACVAYTVSEEAQRDGKEIMGMLRKECQIAGNENEDKESEERKAGHAAVHSKRKAVMSIQEHRVFHKQEVLRKAEREYRLKMKAKSRPRAAQRA